MDSFTQYDIAARRIRDLPTQSPTQSRLQKAIYHQATAFLHMHMLPLKTLPKILKHATPHGSTQPRGALAAIKYNGNETPNANGVAGSSTSLAASDTSSAISALETEEKSLRERLVVLEEQRFFVSEMVSDAQRRRKFDEAASLGENLAELEGEIERVGGRIARLSNDFEGLYLGTASNNESSVTLTGSGSIGDENSYNYPG